MKRKVKDSVLPYSVILPMTVGNRSHLVHLLCVIIKIIHYRFKNTLAWLNNKHFSEKCGCKYEITQNLVVFMKSTCT